MSRTTSLLGMNTCQTILIIEDSPEDFEFTTRALEQAGYAGDWHHVKNGEEALDYLDIIDKAQSSGDVQHFPCMIFLDLNMPRVSGVDVLKTLKSHDYFRKIPVIVISTSDNKKDIDECYQIGSNSYIHKSIDYGQFRDTIASLKSFWLDNVMLPNPMMSAMKNNRPDRFVS